MFASLEGKTALVTGGTRGIGKAIALELKAAGADVIISGTDLARTESIAQEMGMKALAADLSDSEAVTALLNELPEVDILVNNAGITRDGLFMRQKDEDWNAVMSVNVDAAVRLARKVSKKMMSNKWGRIINISSVVGHMGNVGQTNYVASKAAMTGFTKALAQEIARKGVTVNSIAPGFIETEMTAQMTEKALEGMLSKVPAARMGKPEDIAAAVRFLASDEASYINGTTIHVNGALYT